jgi:RES domain-containing protein
MPSDRLRPTVSTVRVFRIVHRTYAADPYSGRGGLHANSRWASRGRLVSYAADNLALATLEMIAGAGSMKRLREMVYAPADIADRALLLPNRDEFPDGWDRRPPGPASRSYGDRWLTAGDSVALRVPSVTLPEGWNVVLNPSHADFSGAVTIGDSRPLDLDPRILSRL